MMTSDQADAFAVTFTADTTEIVQQLNNVAKLGKQVGAALGDAFEGIAIKGRGLGDVLRSLAAQLSKIVLNAALKPFEQALGNAVTGLLGGGGFGGGLFGGAFANGGVLSQGMPIPFARGGVIASPIAFPLAGNRVGIAGERGAEAILPLRRGSDGRLGVAASGGGGTMITFNVTTPDVEGFRRSEGQIAAMLSRTIARGQRQL
jgi:phage-related minor tail protein